MKFNNNTHEMNGAQVKSLSKLKGNTHTVAGDAFSKAKEGSVGNYDKVELILSFVPAENGVGAIFSTFIDAIKIHDTIIKSIEETQVLISALAREFRKKNRLFQNYRVAWSVILPKQPEYEEFKKLSAAMKTFDTDLQQAKFRNNKVRTVD